MEQNGRPHIFRYVSKDKVLDVGDLLDPDPKRCKVRFILLHFVLTRRLRDAGGGPVRLEPRPSRHRRRVVERRR